MLDQNNSCIQNALNSHKSWSCLSDESFVSEIYKIPLSTKYLVRDMIPKEMPEVIFFENSYDILVFRQFHNLYDPMHSHNFFEIFYVYKGNCQLKFENELHTLSEGDLCIIAPDSQHSAINDDEFSTIITICIRKSTFDSSFFQLLTQKNLLSSFFQNILYIKAESNYILFSTDNSKDLKLIMRNLMFEYNKGGAYSNYCCISWINILFSLILRNYSDSVQFYNYKFSNDFYSILNYIQNNYQNLTLKELADFFNYSEAHLSLLIKKNTGLGFMKLITKLKMSAACKYLKNTNLSIEKISELIGYNSCDYFSKAFKKYYSYSPQQYRNKFSLNNK
ncbi:AraC family transcriptional regulator [Clostridium sp. SHJSY1]|uniref:AraC family transcriptional regulator n=1 Tax=Clostridium sp. SHJSY1 TaxID=2942483 RepID=UPI002874B9F3|nr:AraC family transcriptional regulator [Clostridium sp. SHJSY1]MDS0524285.1 AraC family transcriptional regulator [Clostridium sp. SHJSY1]